MENSSMENSFSGESPLKDFFGGDFSRDLG